MERREAIKVMLLGAVGAVVGLPSGEASEAAPQEGLVSGGLNGIIRYFEDMRKRGYTDVACSDDPVRLRIGWLFSKDLKFVENVYPEGMRVDDLPAMVRSRLVHSDRGSPIVRDTKTGRHYLANYLWNDPDGTNPCPHKNLPWGEYMKDEDYVDDVLPGHFHSDHPMYNPQIPLMTLKAMIRDGKFEGPWGGLFAESLASEEGKIALLEALKAAAGW